MKKIASLLGLTLLMLQATAQNMHVEGKLLKNAAGNNVVLRGINYPIMDDGNVDLNTPATYQSAIDQFALTGANCIRIPWNTSGVHWRDGIAPGTMQGYITNGKLGNLIDYCFSKNLTVILEIHDGTCTNNWNYFNNTIVPFWTSAPVVNMINTHASKLIVNIANEFGNDNDWGGSLADFKSNYAAAVQALRNAGIAVPVMIDAPNCGTASSSLVAAAGDILAADNLHNIIFSVHSYWSAYASTNAAIDVKMNEMNSSNKCFVFGEIANRQDVGSCGDTDISSIYQHVLTQACPMGIGWMAWCYNKDCAPTREITNTGTFANLTAFGNDIVNNATYGLNSNTPCSGQSGVPLGLGFDEKTAATTVQVYPNPVSNVFSLQPAAAIRSVQLYDMTGRAIAVRETQPGQYVPEHIPPGIYWLKCILKDGSTHTQKLLYNP